LEHPVHESHRYQNMASFPLKSHILPTPRPFNPKCENVPLAPDRWHSACQV